MITKTHIVICQDDQFYIIIHALDNIRDEYGEFKWYLMVDPNTDKREYLNGQIYESVTLGTAFLKEHKGKWIGCQCIFTDISYDEGCFYLSDNFVDMLKKEQMDSICIADEDGNMNIEYIWPGNKKV